MMKAQMKNLPQDQQDMILGALEKDPEFFKKMAEEIKRETKNGLDQQTASMKVMLKHKDKLRELMKGR